MANQVWETLFKDRRKVSSGSHGFGGERGKHHRGHDAHEQAGGFEIAPGVHIAADGSGLRAARGHQFSGVGHSRGRVPSGGASSGRVGGVASN